MAVTSIHSIKTNLSGTISYIINGDKTVNGLYVSSYLCRDDSRGAAEDFSTARQRGTGRTKILAYHIIQSFKPDEITPEQALAVSEELCDRFLKGRYQYVLAVHTDHDHIHAHIIFNNTNACNGLSFTTEENQGGRRERAWAKLREISDEICNENKLSVIAEPEKSTGISHYERDMQIEGKSWKEKLRYKLAKIIVKSDSFEDFLRRCDKKNIEVVYAPNHKYKLKYRLEGQQKFIRGETLGEFYTADAIAEQIKILSKVTAKTESKAVSEPVVTPPKPQPTPSVTAHKTEPTAAPSERGGVLYNTLLEAMRKKGLSPTPTAVAEPTDRVEITAEEFISDASSQNEPKEMPTEKKIDVWADIRGMRGADDMIAELESAGVMTLDMLKSFFWNIKHDDDHTDELASLSKDITAVDTLITKMKHLADIEPIYKEYQGKSGWSQSRFKKKNADTIEDYENTRKYILEHRKPYYVDGKPPNMADLKNKAKSLKAEYNAISIEHDKFLAKKSAAKKYTKQVRQYLLQKQADKHNEQSRQRKISRKKDVLE